MNPAELHAFLDELEKIAISKGRLKVSQTRAGRRSMSVDTWLRKEKDGSLYKDAEAEPEDKAHWGRAAGVGALAGTGALVGLAESSRRAHADLAKALYEAVGEPLPPGMLEGPRAAAHWLGKAVREQPLHAAAFPALGAAAGLGAYGLYRGAKHLMNKKKTAGLIDSAYGGHGYSQESTASPGPQVGKPASGKKKAGDAPSIDEPSSYPKTEQVQTNQSTTAPYRMM